MSINEFVNEWRIDVFSTSSVIFLQTHQLSSFHLVFKHFFFFLSNAWFRHSSQLVLFSFSSIDLHHHIGLPYNLGYLLSNKKYYIINSTFRLSHFYWDIEIKESTQANVRNLIVFPNLWYFVISFNYKFSFMKLVQIFLRMLINHGQRKKWTLRYWDLSV